MKVKKSQRFSHTMLLILIIAIGIFSLFRLAYPQQIYLAVLIVIFCAFLLDTLIRASYELKGYYLLCRDGLIVKKINYSNIIKLERLAPNNLLGSNAILIYLISKKNTYICCKQADEFLVELQKKVVSTSKVTLYDLKWDKFVLKMADANYSMLSAQKRVIFDLYNYYCEVKEGGHLQLFENSNKTEIDNIKINLAILGEDALDNFLSALEKFNNKQYTITDVESYSKVASELDPYKENDEFYYAKTEKTIENILKEYVTKNIKY